LSDKAGLLQGKTRPCYVKAAEGSPMRYIQVSPNFHRVSAGKGSRSKAKSGVTPKLMWTGLVAAGSPVPKGMIKFDKSAGDVIGEQVAMDLVKAVFPDDAIVCVANKTEAQLIHDEAGLGVSWGLVSQFDDIVDIPIAGHNVTHDEAVIAPEGDGLQGAPGLGFGAILPLAVCLNDPDFVGKIVQNKKLVVDAGGKLTPYLFDWVIGMETGLGEAALRLYARDVGRRVKLGYFCMDPYSANVLSTVPAGKRGAKSAPAQLRSAEVRNLTVASTDSLRMRVIGIVKTLNARMAMRDVLAEWEIRLHRMRCDTEAALTDSAKSPRLAAELKQAKQAIQRLDEIKQCYERFITAFTQSYQRVWQLYAIASEACESPLPSKKEAAGYAALEALYSIRMMAAKTLRGYSAEGVPLAHPQMLEDERFSPCVVTLVNPPVVDGFLQLRVDKNLPQDLNWLSQLCKHLAKDEVRLGAENAEGFLSLEISLAALPSINEALVKEWRFPEQCAVNRKSFASFDFTTCERVMRLVGDRALGHSVLQLPLLMPKTAVRVETLRKALLAWQRTSDLCENFRTLLDKSVGHDAALVSKMKHLSRLRLMLVKYIQVAVLRNVELAMPDRVTQLERGFAKASACDLDETAMVLACQLGVAALAEKPIVTADYDKILRELQSIAPANQVGRREQIQTMRKQVARLVCAEPIFSAWSASVMGSLEKGASGSLDRRVTEALAATEDLLASVEVRMPVDEGPARERGGLKV
jgi:hypothetical protein